MEVMMTIGGLILRDAGEWKGGREAAAGGGGGEATQFN